MITLRDAENQGKKDNPAFEKLLPAYQEAWANEHRMMPLRSRMHNFSFGIKRGFILSLLADKEQVSLQQVMQALPLKNPVSAHSAALFHLNCLVNEGMLRRSYHSKVTWYERIPREEK